ncbi:hypothetical protein [Yokenella regensburgei]|uniref:hypothetical protein n=1 Tax=Yokenella regensburgei TaxID=158877 RepID=UPI001375B9A7|nr:hypothetical protein [Yokenella regensburgei]KAF1366787.1 hypothetical protein FHR25_004752 [Yokenella regensburgei]
MGSKESNYEVIGRGETCDYLIPGKWVFIQRAKEHGGGFWFGRYFEDTRCFWLEFERPTSLREGIEYLFAMSKVEPLSNTFDDDFQLE